MADVVEVDAETGEVTERDFTPDEKAQRKADADAAAAAAQAAEDARATALGKLAALGLTEADLHALGL